MIPWTLIGIADIPNGGGQLKLTRRGDEFSIHMVGARGELMNSRVYNSEQALATLGCANLHSKSDANVLIGGLGMGFTLAAALKVLPVTARVEVAELLPEIIEWNKGPLGECAGMPINDPRSIIYTGDVADLLDMQSPTYDAVLLDVDNGPEGFTQSDNDNLYSLASLQKIHQSLHVGGMLAVWSAWADPGFTNQLKKARFKVTTQTVRARVGKGSRHTIYLAKKTAESSFSKR